MTLLVGVFDQLAGVLVIDRIHHVEEVVSVRQASLRQLVREELHEVTGALHLRPESLHRQLIIHGDVDEPDVRNRNQLLLLTQYLLQEVLVDHGVAWQVKLDCTDVVMHKLSLTMLLEVLDEVSLAVEPARELGSWKSPLLCSLQHGVCLLECRI